MAVANIHRPGALTPTIVLSLGLGIALLVTVIEIDGNLRRQFAAELPAKAPSFYFLDIPADQADALRRLRARAGAAAPSSKKCRCCAGASSPPTASRRKTSSRKRTPPGCCKATAASPMPARSRAARALVEGKWWGPDYDGPPLVSFEKKIADGLGLKLGDPVTVNVLGRNITARIANMRTRRLAEPRHQFRHGVFAARLRRRAAHPSRHAHLSRTAARRRRKARIIRAVAESFPMVTTVRVKDALEAIGAIVANLVLAIRGASALTLLAAALVLGGALAAGHRHRVYDAVILKTLGATRLRLLAAYAIEYLLLGSATAAVRRARRLARRLADRDRPHAPALRLAAAARRWLRRWPRSLVTVALGLDRHLHRLGPKTGPGLEKSVKFCDIPPRAGIPPDAGAFVSAIVAPRGLLTIRNDAGP